MAELLEIGHITKPHGFKGAVVCHVEPAFFDAFLEADMVHIDQFGTKVPYRIETINLLNKGKFKVSFKGLVSEQEALALKNASLWLNENLLPKHQQLDIIGFNVEVVGRGFIGVITDINEQTIQTIVTVEHDDQAYLIPLVNEFIAALDEKKRTLTLDLPEGLLEI